MAIKVLVISAEHARVQWQSWAAMRLEKHVSNPLISLCIANGNTCKININ